MKSSREQFEAWFIQTWPDYGMDAHRHKLALLIAWQASRAAIEIELPWLGQSSLMETDDVVEAIELQGLTAKAKP